MEENRRQEEGSNAVTVNDSTVIQESIWRKIPYFDQLVTFRKQNNLTISPIMEPLIDSSVLYAIIRYIKTDKNLFYLVGLLSADKTIDQVLELLDFLCIDYNTSFRTDLDAIHIRILLIFMLSTLARNTYEIDQKLKERELPRATAAEFFIALTRDVFPII